VVRPVPAVEPILEQLEARRGPVEFAKLNIDENPEARALRRALDPDGDPLRGASEETATTRRARARARTSSAR
jgi:hypothetical protein